MYACRCFLGGRAYYIAVYDVLLSVSICSELFGVITSVGGKSVYLLPGLWLERRRQAQR